MAGQTLPQLTAGANPVDGDLFYTVQGGGTNDRSVTALQVANYAQAKSLVQKITGVFTADGQIGSIPAGAMIVAVTFHETTGNAVSVSLGTAAGGAQVLAATNVAGNSIVPINGPNLSLQAWVANQGLFIHSAAWGLSSVTVSVWYVQ